MQFFWVMLIIYNANGYYGFCLGFLCTYSCLSVCGCACLFLSIFLNVSVSVFVYMHISVCMSSVYVSLTLGSSSSVVERPHMAQWVIGSTPHGGHTECSITILSVGRCI